MMNLFGRRRHKQPAAANEFSDQLNLLIDHAAKAGVTHGEIATILGRRAGGFRRAVEMESERRKYGEARHCSRCRPFLINWARRTSARFAGTNFIESRKVRGKTERGMGEPSG
jgi:hypothetical protein